MKRDSHPFGEVDEVPSPAREVIVELSHSMKAEEVFLRKAAGTMMDLPPRVGTVKCRKILISVRASFTVKPIEVHILHTQYGKEGGGEGKGMASIDCEAPEDSSGN